MLDKAFAGGLHGQASGGPDRIDRILGLMRRYKEIDDATSVIRYSNELVTELADVLKTLGDARDAVIAELKTV